MNPRPLYQILASTLQALENCVKSGNNVWASNHQAELDRLVSEHMPSGAGIDNGTKLCQWESDFRKAPDRLVFSTSFHHMTEDGMYDGWTEHKVTVKPSLAYGITIDISGRDRNDIKDYLHEVFWVALNTGIARIAETEKAPEHSIS